MKDGGPAFPCIEPKVIYEKRWDERDKEWVPTTRVEDRQEYGMSLRDYFAAKAMQALVADPESSGMGKGNMAAWAYEMADAMLKERDKQ